MPTEGISSRMLLELLGFVPGLGDIVDAALCGWDGGAAIVEKGSTGDAAISCLAMVPFVGSFGRTVKWGDEAAAWAIRTCNSFGARTLVLMANGERKAISEVKVGEYVYATDPETGETGAREVLATMPHTDQLLTLRTSSGDVVTTEDHKYWNTTDQAWQESQDLDAGDRLLSADGDIVAVEGLDWSTVHTDAAYDLTIEDLHTFYVDVGAGDESVLVHNSDCGFDELEVLHAMSIARTLSKASSNTLRSVDAM